MILLIKNIFRLQRALRGKDLFIFEKNIKGNISFGNKNARWTINENFIGTNPIVYSFGVGKDISFDLKLIEMYNAKIYAFDPTPMSISWIKNQKIPSNFNFYDIALGKKDGIVDFFVPKNKKFVSGTTSSGEIDSNKIKVKSNCIGTIISKFKHRYIDILKMDIEGSEYGVIDDILKLNIPIKQILIEFHHRMHPYSLKDSKKVIDKLRLAGYTINSISLLGEEYTFLLR